MIWILKWSYDMDPQIELSYGALKCFYCVMSYDIDPQMELLYHTSNRDMIWGSSNGPS
jgi:hypothetical protein